MPPCTERTAPPSPNHAVALKVLDDHHRREDQTARLRREFEFAHQLDHPHVVTVYEHGTGWLSDGTGRRWDVDHPGRARRDRLTALAQIADALDYAHRCGIVHCDVKPSNILVSQDFSRARADRLRRRATQSPRPSGGTPTHIEASLPYTAPELLHGRPPSALTDRVRAGVHGGRVATRCATIHGRHVDGTRRRSAQPARRRATRARSPGCHVFSTRCWARRWRRTRTAATTRARSSSRSSPARWA